MQRQHRSARLAPGTHERMPLSGSYYQAFIDPAGGSGTDAMTLAIGHREDDVVVLDAIREVRPPFSPEQTVADFARLIKSYSISSPVQGDRYAGDWPAEQFRKHGVVYEPSAKPKSDLYRDVLPLLNSRELDLLDNQRLIAQLVGLERHTARSGKDSIDHPPGAHDDLANCVAGVAAMLREPEYDTSMSWVFGKGAEGEQAMREWDALQLQLHIMRNARW
jgi:hypothetical protein